MFYLVLSFHFGFYVFFSGLLFAIIVTYSSWLPFWLVFGFVFNLTPKYGTNFGIDLNPSSFIYILFILLSSDPFVCWLLLEFGISKISVTIYISLNTGFLVMHHNVSSVCECFKKMLLSIYIWHLANIQCSSYIVQTLLK